MLELIGMWVKSIYKTLVPWFTANPLANTVVEFTGTILLEKLVFNLPTTCLAIAPTELTISIRVFPSLSITYNLLKT